MLERGSELERSPDVSPVRGEATCGRRLKSGLEGRKHWKGCKRHACRKLKRRSDPGVSVSGVVAGQQPEASPSAGEVLRAVVTMWCEPARAGAPGKVAKV